MAIPTDFSVTTANVSPIANPDLPVEKPQLTDAEQASSVISPSVKDAESSPSIPAPGVLTANAPDPTAPPFPLNHARILYDNVLFNYSSIVSDGNGAENAIKPNTYERWQFGASGEPSIKLYLQDSPPVDTVCIGAHNLNELSGTVSVRVRYTTSPTGPADMEFATKLVKGRGAVFIHIDNEKPARQLEVTILGGFGGGYIGYISAGVALQMMRPQPFSGHSVMLENRDVRYYDAWTESGNLVARSRRSVKLSGSFNFNNIKEEWYTEYFQPFRDSAEVMPFFIARNLEEYPYEATMALGDNFEAPYSGTRNWRSVSFDAKGPV